MRRNGFFSLWSALAFATVAAAACGGDVLGGDGRTVPTPGVTALCQMIRDEVISGAVKDGIPAVQLRDSDLVDPDNQLWLDFLLPTDRVIGLEVDGQYLAVPLNILWWHEILNLNDHGLAITYCPLTGTSMVFKRDVVAGVEFGTSGLLFKNNLVMYDRTDDPLSDDDSQYSLWPQMLVAGFCGPSEGKTLTMVPSIEIEWEDWLVLHPDTKVVGSNTGNSRNYTVYPYGTYRREDNALTLVPLDNIDTRRPPKELVLGIPFTESPGGIAFPFGALRDAAGGGDLAVVHTILGDGMEGQGGVNPVVVFWDARAGAAAAFSPGTSLQDLTFEVRNGAFVDLETGTEWSIEGKGLSGPLAGQQLLRIVESYVAFWFAFAEFFPNTVIWLP